MGMVDVDRIRAEVVNSKQVKCMKRDIETKVEKAILAGRDYIDMSLEEFRLAVKLEAVGKAWYGRDKGNGVCEAYFKDTYSKVCEDRKVKYARFGIVAICVSTITVAILLSF